MIPIIVAQQLRGFFYEEKIWTHIDWLTITLPVNRLTSLKTFIDSLWNKTGVYWESVRGKNFYECGLVNKFLGITVNYTPVNGGCNAGSSSIAFSGIFFSRVGDKGVLSLLTYLSLESSVSCSRIDIACNHFVQRDPLTDFTEGLRSGLYTVAGGDGYTIVEKADQRNMSTGRTLYLGSRRSDCYTRIYDAMPVHGDGLTLPHGWNWIRHEVESKGKFSRLLFSELMRGVCNNNYGISNLSYFLKYTLRAYLCRHEIQIRESGDRSSRRQPCLEWKLLRLSPWNMRHRYSTAPVPLEATIQWLIRGGPIKYLKALYEHSGSFSIIQELFDAWSDMKIEKGHDPVAEILSVRGLLGSAPPVIRALDCQSYLFGF